MSHGHNSGDEESFVAEFRDDDDRQRSHKCMEKAHTSLGRRVDSRVIIFLKTKKGKYNNKYRRKSCSHQDDAPGENDNRESDSL